MISKVNKQLQKSIESFNKISHILENKKTISTERSDLLIAYFDIDMEHIQAIHLLISNKLIGSAFALVRPFYETYYRALWMLKYATEKEVEEIRTGKFNFPNMGSKIEQLDNIFTGTDFFKQLKANGWNAMNDYTHSGIRQLARRFTEDKLEPNYSDGEIIEVIKGTNAILLLFVYVILKENGYEDEAAKINDILKESRDSLPISAIML